MARELYIPPCVDSPPHQNHPPSLERPLRIHIQGPLPSPQPAALQLAELAFGAIYGLPTNGDRLTVRDEYNAWVREPQMSMEIDYYGVTFDYRVPKNEADPEVLAVNIIEMEEQSGEYANGIEYAQKYLRLQVDPTEYFGTKVLAVPRCCQWKKGSTDRTRINTDVQKRAQKAKDELKQEVRG
ncbi:hypothetical protein K505DRAFT_354678 [Melanomma pulvis-pyrius CBS 109.77]|uniref:Uncharacterized protein n=1 Tax=Melanomma pulvis-pyrius CBS 109.77 TaxID=1314802 RepID=A0A6A6WPQ6_9PLEO|nr:hypothetical protein K505DRAFT_354678 [Melanomma pulvis-pyrius CBS 109.77]